MEVTLSPKRAKSRTRSRKRHLTGAKARAGRAHKTRADLEQQLKACRRELSHARESLAEAIRFVVDKGTPAAAQKWQDETGRQWSVNVNRVKKSLLGSDFTVERMTDFSREGALLCAVVITRIA